MCVLYTRCHNASSIMIIQLSSINYSRLYSTTVYVYGHYLVLVIRFRRVVWRKSNEVFKVWPPRRAKSFRGRTVGTAGEPTHDAPTNAPCQRAGCAHRWRKKHTKVANKRQMFDKRKKKSLFEKIIPRRDNFALSIIIIIFRRQTVVTIFCFSARRPPKLIIDCGRTSACQTLCFENKKK